MLTDSLAGGAHIPALLDCLVHARIADPYAVFFVTGEGVEMPDGNEERSGYVIDGTGRVFSFWLEWNPEIQAPDFSHWELVEPQDHWLRSPEYVHARKAVGLSLPGPAQPADNGPAR